MRAVTAAAIVGIAASQTSFDPPFAFPGLPKPGDKVPTEVDFGRACFRFIYSMNLAGGKGAVEKKEVKHLSTSKIPESMMNSCLQKDREGCHRFAEQLQAIVERKESEPALTKRASKHHGKPISQAERKAAKKALRAKEVAKILKSQASQPAEKDSAKSAKAEEPKQIKEYGMKVWKPHHKKTSLLSVEEYGLIPTDKHGNAISLIQTERRPQNYGDWCTKLYAAATASWDPKATTTTTTPKATTAASGSTTQGPIAYLSQEASKGDKELQVDRLTPTLGVGDTIILNKGATNEETLTVSGFGSILVEEGLKFNHKDGEPIILSAKALGKTDSKVSGDKKGGDEGGDPGATAGIIAVIVVVILLVVGGAVATFFVLKMRRQNAYSANMKIGPRGNKAITIASTNDMNSPTY